MDIALAEEAVISHLKGEGNLQVPMEEREAVLTMVMALSSLFTEDMEVVLLMAMAPAQVLAEEGGVAQIMDMEETPIPVDKRGLILIIAIEVLMRMIGLALIILLQAKVLVCERGLVLSILITVQVFVERSDLALTIPFSFLNQSPQRPDYGDRSASPHQEGRVGKGYGDHHSNRCYDGKEEP
ncbi:hypothetical protein Ancab_009602 [Ancistrocladus abbreviatus]